MAPGVLWEAGWADKTQFVGPLEPQVVCHKWLQQKQVSSASHLAKAVILIISANIECRQ